MVEQLSDEGGMGGWGVCGVVRDIARALDLNLVSVVRLENAVVVNGFALLPGSPATDRILLLKTEAEGVDR